ncbi:D-alanyl carrier protein [Streptomyces sp. CB02923]|uniref:phosphopantetheine-binding protein n=1 Tax=Streptomyces sp. CB02923 TaxID=1718985 RepID=UPI00093D229C|nr:phosphopantetheine-binding protein [Streptomyces sp. CB02923]OKH99763.1 D-alanyl carrier protein [Streptomyces sp. CB02923]
MDDIKSATRTFIGKYVRNRELADHEDLFASGFVNSLFIMQLVMFVESELGTPVADEDLQMDNFRSVDAVAAFVARKAAATPAA